MNPSAFLAVLPYYRTYLRREKNTPVSENNPERHYNGFVHFLYEVETLFMLKMLIYVMANTLRAKTPGLLLCRYQKKNCVEKKASYSFGICSSGAPAYAIRLLLRYPVAIYSEFFGSLIENYTN